MENEVDERGHRAHGPEVVRPNAEETLTGVLAVEADAVYKPQRHERKAEGGCARAGHSQWSFQTTAGQVRPRFRNRAIFPLNNRYRALSPEEKLLCGRLVRGPHIR